MAQRMCARLSPLVRKNLFAQVMATSMSAWSRRSRSRVARHITLLGQVSVAVSAEGDDSEEEMLLEGRRWRGRIPGSRNIERGVSSWITDYLTHDAVYPLYKFRRRFRIPRMMFRTLLKDLVDKDPDFWGVRKNAAGRVGILPEIKVLACLRVLGTGRSFDDIDDSARMGAETVRQYFRRFVQDIICIYGPAFLNRRPTVEELDGIEEKYADRGFPGCVGCVDCCKLVWKNCPTALKGQYHNSKDGKLATISVEAWSDGDLYIWHWNAGRCGTNNDITMVEVSPLFQDILGCQYKFRLSRKYKIVDGGRERDMPYYLVDGIYPDWPLFVKPIHDAEEESHVVYTKRQEGTRKDVERLFGVFQTRFAVMRRESMLWASDDVVSVSECCVILHNMLIRMWQRGEFEEDMEEGNVDIVAELYEEELQRGVMSRQETMDTLEELRETQTENVTFDLEQMFVRETFYTSPVAYYDLQQELIQSFLS